MFENLFSKGGLSLDRLRSFMQMAEAKSIAKAAPGDANRQSQISRQIRELEDFFDTELTRRKGKTLTLSAAGERLALLIREQLQDLEDFRKEQKGQPKSFVIGGRRQRAGVARDQPSAYHQRAAGRRDAANRKPSQPEPG